MSCALGAMPLPTLNAGTINRDMTQECCVIAAVQIRSSAYGCDAQKNLTIAIEGRKSQSDLTGITR
jgi:hypothetical protein